METHDKKNQTILEWEAPSYRERELEAALEWLFEAMQEETGGKRILFRCDPPGGNFTAGDEFELLKKLRERDII